MRKIRYSILHKTFAAILIILLPILAAFFSSYINNREHIKKIVLDDLTVMAEAFEGQVYQFIEMSSRRAEDFASDGLIKRLLQEYLDGGAHATGDLVRHLERSKMVLDESMDDILVMTPDGRIAASTHHITSMEGIAKEPFFTKGQSGTFMGESHLFHPGMTELAVSTPVINERTGKKMGIIVIFFRLSELNRILSGEFNKDLGALSWTKGRHHTMEAYIVDRDGLMITESLFIEGAPRTLKVDTLPVRRCLESNEEVAAFYQDYRGVDVAGASMCIPSKGWTLLVEYDSEEALASVAAMRRDVVIAGLMVVLLILVFFWFFFRRFVLRLQGLSAATEEVAEGRYDITVPVKTNDEIGVLTRSFNSMASDILARNKALAESAKLLKNTSSEVTYRLATVAELRDNETGAHVKRIGAYSALIARELGMNEQFVEAIELSSVMHDIGKVGIPDSILLKQGPLSAEESEIMKTHTTLGANIFTGSEYYVIQMAGVVAISHHERWDGTGYPRGLMRDEIPMEGRIVMLADQYDALRSERPYKPPFDHERTVRIITEGDGRTLPGHFDPALMELFKRISPLMAGIFDSLQD